MNATRFILKKKTRQKNYFSKYRSVRLYSQFVYRENKKKFQKKKKDERKTKLKRLSLPKKPEFTLEKLKEQESIKIIPPTSLTVPVMSFDTSEPLNETITLPGDVFAYPIRPDILHFYVRWHLANKRQGTASSKRRGEVRGSTRKLYQQKKLVEHVGVVLDLHY